MINQARRAIGLAVVVTSATLVTWLATGGDYYTKYEVIEEVRTPLDADDPLAATGFYEGTSQTQTVVRNEFRFGLLPTPQGVFDKHAISVASFAVPSWIVAVGVAWWPQLRRKRRRRIPA